MPKTPLTDFLATLADPLKLDQFRANPRSVVEQAQLSDELGDLVLRGHAGAIRVQAVKELEAAGLSPLVSQHFISDAAQQPMNISMNSYTSSTYTAIPRPQTPTLPTPRTTPQRPATPRQRQQTTASQAKYH